MKNTSRVRNNVLFSCYAYVNHLLFVILDLMPPFVRSAAFKCMLKKCGRNAFIDYKTYFRYPSKISLGDNVSINRYCRFYPSYLNQDARIIIQDNVIIGPECTFFSAGQDPRREGFPDIADTIRIEEDVYIGGRSTIRYGVTIGKGSVIAAGSVVVRDIPPYSVAGGVPAKIIKKRDIRTQPGEAVGL